MRLLQDGRKSITLASRFAVVNKCPMAISLWMFSGRDTLDGFCVGGKKSKSVPVTFDTWNRFGVSENGLKISIKPGDDFDYAPLRVLASHAKRDRTIACKVASEEALDNHSGFWACSVRVERKGHRCDVKDIVFGDGLVDHARRRSSATFKAKVNKLARVLPPVQQKTRQKRQRRMHMRRMENKIVCTTLYVQPFIIIRNNLPIPISYCVDEDTEDEKRQKHKSRQNCRAIGVLTAESSSS